MTPPPLTPEELDHFRTKLKVEALWTLVRALYTAAARMTPNGAQNLREQFQVLRQTTDTVAIPGLPPEYSNLVADEFRAALDDYLTDLERRLPE